MSSGAIKGAAFVVLAVALRAGRNDPALVLTVTILLVSVGLLELCLAGVFRK